MIDLKIDKAGVATVTLNRADKHNAFDDVLIAEMTSIFRQIDADENVRVMVLAANGKHFSAGGDLAWMQKMASYSGADNLKDARALAEMLSVLNSINKPTIARVQGAAFGGAVGLVSCCDIVLAAESASFCLSEVKIGLIPATISPYVIAAMGVRAARRYFLTAERFDAQAALLNGLVSQVCAEDELDEHVAQFIKHLMGNGPKAIAGAKKLIADVESTPLGAALIEETCKRIAEIRVSEEGQEGLNAFLNKRAPNWLPKKAND